MKLFEVLSKINDPADIEVFFQDLCTPQEIEQMNQRVECAQLFLNGETYQNISKKTDVSSATLSRVSRCIQFGSGGYSKILKKITNEK